MAYVRRWPSIWPRPKETIMDYRILRPSGWVVSLLISFAVLAGAAAPCASAASAASESKMSTAEAEKKREAVRTMRDDALAGFYATQAEIKAEVAKAVGYAVFDGSQVNVLVFVGGLGRGVLVDNGTGKETFMKMK